MDFPDVTAITKIVKMVGTEFKSASDEDVSFWIGMQAPVISKKKFGADYNLAVALLVCHAMKMAGNGDSSLGTISNTGRLASVSRRWCEHFLCYQHGGNDGRCRISAYFLRIAVHCDS